MNLSLDHFDFCLGPIDLLKSLILPLSLTALGLMPHDALQGDRGARLARPKQSGSVTVPTEVPTHTSLLPGGGRSSPTGVPWGREGVRGWGREGGEKGGRGEYPII